MVTCVSIHYSSSRPRGRGHGKQGTGDYISGRHAFAERTGVRLYLDRLARVKVLPSNMATRRFIGFGGVVTAVPMILPALDWKGEQTGVAWSRKLGRSSFH